MRIIVCHNYYRNRGGSDFVFEDEVELLESRGHEVHRFTRDNEQFSLVGALTAAAGTIWNRSASSELGDLVREIDADVVHFHNWLPQISQGAFHAAGRAGAAVVHTLHNYRFTCANGVLCRSGAVCEECVGKAIGWPALKHGCYHDSRAATVPVVAALATHRALGTNNRVGDAIIVLSEFARSKMIESGLAPDRLHVKPNFVDPDPGVQEGDGGYFAYIGRLTEYKGISTLVDAWNMMEDPPLLKIVGSGDLSHIVESAASTNPKIEYLGQVPMAEVPTILGGASFSIMPSITYEGFPKAIVESFAVGTPVIASDLGSLTELIDTARTGFLFDAGDSGALAKAVESATAISDLDTMRSASRRDFVDHYGVDRNYKLLMDIYESAIKSRYDRT